MFCGSPVGRLELVPADVCALCRVRVVSHFIRGEGIGEGISVRCVLENKQVRLFLNSLLLSPSWTLFASWEPPTHSLAPRALHSCYAATAFTLWTLCLPLACCRPVERLRGPPVPRPSVAAPTAELTKERRSVGGLAVAGWSLSHTMPGRKPWTLTEMCWAPWLRWNSSPGW